MRLNLGFGLDPGRVPTQYPAAQMVRRWGRVLDYPAKRHAIKQVGEV